MGGRAHRKFHGFNTAVCDAVQGVHDAALRVLHASNNAKNLRCRNKFGRHDAVQADGSGDAGVILSIAFGDDFGQVIITDCNGERMGNILHKADCSYKLFNVTYGEVVKEE